jgi:hypothetical protein
MNRRSEPASWRVARRNTGTSGAARGAAVFCMQTDVIRHLSDAQNLQEQFSNEKGEDRLQSAASSSLRRTSSMCLTLWAGVAPDVCSEGPCGAGWWQSSAFRQVHRCKSTSYESCRFETRRHVSRGDVYVANRFFVCVATSILCRSTPSVHSHFAWCSR